MLYFSEIKNKKVITEDGITVGKINDLIFNATETPKTTKLSIQTKENKELIVPLSYLKKIDSNFTIFKNYTVDELEDQELYIGINLLNKQIIDIKGNKIVRVNDILIQDKQEFIIAGVDTSFIGLLRWFGLENNFLNFLRKLRIKINPEFLSWVDIQPLELSKGKVILKKEQEKLGRIPPEDLADYLEKTTIINVRRLLNMIDEKLAAEIIGNLNINYQTELFNHFPDNKSARVINLIDPDEAVDILLTISRKRRQRILEILSVEKKRELEYLFSLSKTPIGKILTTEFMTVNPEYTAKQVISIISKELSDFSFLSHIYVVNKLHRLVGVFNLHELLLQHDDTPVYKFMIQNVIVIHLTTPLEILVKKMIKYKIDTIPVINKEKNILGAIVYDNVAEFLLKKI